MTSRGLPSLVRLNADSKCSKKVANSMTQSPFKNNGAAETQPLLLREDHKQIDTSYTGSILGVNAVGVLCTIVFVAVSVWRNSKSTRTGSVVAYVTLAALSWLLVFSLGVAESIYAWSNRYVLATRVRTWKMACVNVAAISVALTLLILTSGLHLTCPVSHESEMELWAFAFYMDPVLALFIVLLATLLCNDGNSKSLVNSCVSNEFLVAASCGLTLSWSTILYLAFRVLHLQEEITTLVALALCVASGLLLFVVLYHVNKTTREGQFYSGGDVMLIVNDVLLLTASSLYVVACQAIVDGVEYSRVERCAAVA